MTVFHPWPKGTSSCSINFRLSCRQGCNFPCDDGKSDRSTRPKIDARAVGVCSPGAGEALRVDWEEVVSDMLKLGLRTNVDLYQQMVSTVTSSKRSEGVLTLYFVLAMSSCSFESGGA